MARKPSKTDDSEQLSTLKETESVLLGQLRAIKETQENREYAGFDEELAMAAAAVGRALTSVRGEMRQHAKAERRSLESFSLEAILDYLRTLPIDQRCRIAEDLTGARDEEALL